MSMLHESFSLSPSLVPGESLAARRVLLPGGVLDAAGRCHKAVRLRELDGSDEELLCADYSSGARQVTVFLARAIAAIEGFDGPVDEALVADMLVGDRDYLLLRLRQIEVGDAVHQVLRCPAPACAKKVDVDFSISELPVRRLERVEEGYELRLLVADGPPLAARSRLPSGADLEAVWPLLAVNAAEANTRLYSRILQRVEGMPRLDEAALRAMPLRLRNQLAQFIASQAPGPDLGIEIICPHCGADMSYRFDLTGFFLPSVQ